MKPGLSLKVLIIALLLLLSVMENSESSRVSLPATTLATPQIAVPRIGPFAWPSGSGAGTWQPPADSKIGPLYAIAAIAPDDAWAVGETTDNPHLALAIHWDGKSWDNPFTLDTGLGDNVLQAIAAISHDDVWAVGSVRNGNEAERMLIAHWDGQKWELMPLPAINLTGSELNAIDAIGPDDIWAAGSSQDAPALVMHWDGQGWTVLPTNQHQSPSPTLYGIDAVSANDVWVAGDAAILHWDGKSWTQTYTRNEYTARFAPIRFTDIKALSTNDVWAVGNFDGMTDCGFAVGYIMHWDGSRWAEAESLGGQCTPVLRLNKIFAMSLNNIWVVGQSGWTPLIMHWNGYSWSTDPCPGGMLWAHPYGAYGGDLGKLSGIAQITGESVWAVGSTYQILGDTIDQTGAVLDARHGACPAAPTPAPPPTRPPPPTIPAPPTPPLPQLTSYAPISTGEPQVPIPAYTTVPSVSTVPQH